MLRKGENKLNYVIIGCICGLLNGFFGGGGGMVVVPLLTYLVNRENKTAHATAIFIILPISIVSGIIYICLGAFDFSVGLPTSIGVFLGGIAGAFILSKTSSKKITFIFVAIMFLSGVKMLFF